MKVILINGSSKVAGCTFTALREVADQLEKENVTTEIIHIGTKAINGCVACGKCAKTDKCSIDDIVNELLVKMENSDGLIIGSPVHYAAPAGNLISLLNRMFYSSNKAIFENKPASAIVSARRAGTTASLDILNKYFTITNMPVVSSQYWNMVHGSSPNEVEQDLEGMQIMRTLGINMAWLLKSIEAGKKAGLPLPQKEVKVRTNFIR